MSARFSGLAFFAMLALCAATQAAVILAAVPALARDGSSGGGSSGGGSSGGGSSGGGSSGGGSSGSGSSGSHGSDGGGSDGGGSGRGRSGDGTSGRDGGDGGPQGSGGQHDGDDRGRRVGARRDQDVVRDAVVRGAAVPLAKVLPTVRAAVRGDVLDVKLRWLGSGALVYDVMVLSAEGEYRSVVVDAKRNRVIETGRR